MTVSTTTSRISYPGAGSTGPFAVPFRIYAAADLELTKRDVAGGETTLANIADYVVTGAGQPTCSLVLSVVLAAGEELTIRRVMPITQGVSLTGQGPYFGKTHEDEFDRLTMVDQQQQEQLSRSLRVMPSMDPATIDMVLRELTAGKVLVGTGTGLTMATVDRTGVVLPGAGRTVQTLSEYLANNAVYNVKDYGAIGDGVADDTLAVQAAVNAGAGVIYHPAGNYSHNAVTVPSNREMVGAGEAVCTVTQRTAGQDLYVGNGTMNAHKSHIGFRGFKYVGIEGTVASHVVFMSWVDHLKLRNCSFENIYAINLGYAGETYASIDVTKLSHHIDVLDNDWTSSVNGDGSAAIFLKYCRDFTIALSRMNGRLGSSSSSSAIEVWGGDGTVAGDGALANARKCRNGVIFGNALTGWAGGIATIMTQDVVVGPNTLDGCGEALDAIGCFDTSFLDNVVNGGSHCLQWSGINRNLVYRGNIVSTTSANGLIYASAEAAYLSEDNAGPIIFEDNDLRCTVGGHCVIDGNVGYLAVRRNRFLNASFILEPAKISQFEFEDNTSIFDLFDAAFPNYLLRLTGFNTPTSGIAGTKVFTSVRRNKWIDRTAAYTGAVIQVYDPGQSSTLWLEENEFEGAAGLIDIQIGTTSGAITLTTVIARNKLSPNQTALNTDGQNTATNSIVKVYDNLDTAGKNWLGAIPAGNFRASIGSWIRSNDPAATGFEGWLVTVSGHPATWKTYAPVTP